MIKAAVTKIIAAARTIPICHLSIVVSFDEIASTNAVSAFQHPFLWPSVECESLISPIVPPCCRYSPILPRAIWRRGWFWLYRSWIFLNHFQDSTFDNHSHKDRLVNPEYPVILKIAPVVPGDCFFPIPAAFATSVVNTSSATKNTDGVNS